MNTKLNKSTSVRAAMYLTWLLVLVLSAAFIVTFTGIAFSKGMMMPRGDERTLRGEVIAVDTGHYIRTLTMQSGQLGPFPNNELNIFVNKGTRISVCGMNEPASNLQVDRNATVTYREVGGVPVAARVSERC